MRIPAPLSPEVWAALPPAVVALIQGLTEELARLTARVVELEAKLGKNPTNSSKPPSSVHPHAKPVSPRKKGRKYRGDQPGHIKVERAGIPVEQCTAMVPVKPESCRRCGEPLAGSDLQSLRHQVWEVPEIKPLVTEY